MATRGGDLQGPNRMHLTLHVAEVDFVGWQNGLRECVEKLWLDKGGAVQIFDHLNQGLHAIDIETGSNRCLRRVGFRQNQALEALLQCHQRHADGAIYGPKHAVQPKFAQDHGLLQLFHRDLAALGRDSNGDRKI